MSCDLLYCELLFNPKLIYGLISIALVGINLTDLAKNEVWVCNLSYSGLFVEFGESYSFDFKRYCTYCQLFLFWFRVNQFETNFAREVRTSRQPDEVASTTNRIETDFLEKFGSFVRSYF